MIKFKFLTNLPHTPRWAGKRLLFPESVSDHIWGMNALAIELSVVLMYLDLICSRT